MISSFVFCNTLISFFENQRADTTWMSNPKTTKKWQVCKRDFVLCIDFDLCFIRGSIGWQNKGVLWIGNVSRDDVLKMIGMIANMEKCCLSSSQQYDS